MAVTLDDIAEKADISKTTVSRVLNGKKSDIPISPDTEKKVMEIAKELGYRPNINARNLSTQRSYMMGFIIDDILDPFFNELIKGVEEHSRKRGYRLILSTIGSDSLENVVDNLLNQSAIEGLIIGATNQLINDHKIIEDINNRGVPTTLLGHYYEHAPSIFIDNFKGGYKATSYLINLGHEKIGIITGPERRNDSEERLRGYKQALKDNDLSIEEDLIETGNFSYESGYQKMKTLLGNGQIPDAVFGCDDMTALGAISAANELNFKVPEDISIIGFDNVIQSEYSAPKLTTIAQPRDQMGRRAVRLMIDLIEENEIDEQQIKFDPELMVRESCIKK